MGLGILGGLILLCAVLTQILLIPIHAIEFFHLSLPFWLGQVQTWIMLAGAALVSAWLLGDR